MLRPLSALGVPMVLLVVASLGSAQCVSPEWRLAGQRPDIFIQANAATTFDPDGFGPSPERLVVAGSSTVSNSFSMVATWDGVAWEAFPSATDLGGSPSSPFITGIYALTNWNGSLIAAGDFTAIGGVAANRVARWNGSSWEPLGGGLPDRVNVLATYNGDLVAGGRTMLPSGLFGGYVARWNGVAWQPLGAGVFEGGIFGPGVTTMVELNGELFVGGNFTSVGGIAAGSIAKWNGSSWQPIGPTASTWGVYRVAVYNGELIVGAGNVFNSGVLAAQNIARWDGVQFQPMGALFGPAASPFVTFNGDLIASGSGGVFRWDGVSWSPLGPVPYGAGTVTTFAGELIGRVDALPGNGISRWDGSAWQPLGAGFDGRVETLTTFEDDVIAGGYFTAANGAVGNRIARWNGAAWQPLGLGFDNSVTALGIYGGELIAAGGLSTGGVATGPIARWTGSVWVPLAPPSAGSPAGIYALVNWNGDLVAGGWFTTAGGVTVNGIARWDGTTWHPLGSGMSWSPNPGQVRALTVFNGDLIAGGSFDVAGGVTVNAIARWDGVAWHPLGSGTGFYGSGTGEVMALAVANGQLYVGGNFTEAGGAPANHVARWDGTSWHPLGAGIDDFGPYTVMALAVSGADVFVGGMLFTAGGVNANGIARWDGSAWFPMGAGLTGYGSATRVNALTVYHGAVIAGGMFNWSWGLSVPYVARWSSPLPMLAVSQPGGAGSGVQVRNAWLLPGHEYYNLASLDLAPGGPGSGPYGGLSYVDVSVLISQLSMPAGVAPFHIVASGATATHGLYTVPPGITFEAISVDVTGGSLGCISTALQYTTY